MESYTSLGEILVSRDAVMEFVYSSFPYPAVNITLSLLMLLLESIAVVGAFLSVIGDVDCAFAIEGCWSIGMDVDDKVATWDMNVRRSFSLLFDVLADDSDDDGVVKVDDLIAMDGVVHA